jgi:hypothetical protein
LCSRKTIRATKTKNRIISVIDFSCIWDKDRGAVISLDCLLLTAMYGNCRSNIATKAFFQCPQLNQKEKVHRSALDEKLKPYLDGFRPYPLSFGTPGMVYPAF